MDKGKLAKALKELDSQLDGAGKSTKGRVARNLGDLFHGHEFKRLASLVWSNQNDTDEMNHLTLYLKARLKA